MARPSTIAQAIREIENWPEVFSLKMGLGSRELSLMSFRNGLKVVCRRDSCDWDIVRDLLLTGGYRHSVAYLREVKASATVLDLGGNIGCFSLLAAARNGLLGIRTYEPGPPNIRMFRLNCLMNPELADRIELREEAVGGTTRRTRWHFNADNPGGSSLYAGGPGGEAVQVRAFSEVVDAVSGAIALVKIDIEGAEYELLDATHEETWSRIPALTIEVHDDPDGVRGKDEVLARFRSLGYRVDADDEFAWFCHR